MKLDRNTNRDGRGKYAVIDLRRLREACGRPNALEQWTPEVAQALKTLSEAGALEWGPVGGENEFFLMKLKDEYAKPALEAYANAASREDAEYAEAVQELANRAGCFSPFCKKPD
jgi:hypothetical protein